MGRRRDRDLLPGSGYSAKAFELLGPELARRGYRAVAVNPRGVGKSVGPRANLTYHDYAADVGAVIDRIAGGRAHVLGWAWGKPIARCLAADSPGRVASITLIAAGGKFPSDPSVAALTKQIAQPGMSAHGIVVEHPVRLADETVRFLRAQPVQRSR